jgi:hypothetical protein
MPAVLTHKSIMLLARERLADIRDTLKAKIRSGAHVTDLEHRVAHLAEKAFDLMSEDPTGTSGTPSTIDFPRLPSSAFRLGAGVSRYAVMGSMGPDITGFSAQLGRHGGWVFDTVHKGTPDGDRELVSAATTTFVFKLWDELTRAIGGAAGVGDATKERWRQQMRAYILGHLCHVAGDMLSHPYVNDVEWHLSTAIQSKFSHASGESAIDALVARQVLRRASTREGQDWSAWWPTQEEVPRIFFDAYAEALEQTYHTRTSRPIGFGEFEAVAEADGLPPATGAFVKDGYRTYRHGALIFAYDWGYGDWFGFLTPLVLPLAAAFPLMFAMPYAGKLFQPPGPPTPGVDTSHDEERGFFEAMTLPMAATSVTTLFYGAWIAGITTFAGDGLMEVGLVFSALSVLAAFGFFISLGFSGEGLPWWFRWIFLFGLPAGVGLYSVVRAIVEGATGHTARAYVSLLFALPLLASVLASALFLPLKKAGTDGMIAYGIVGGILSLVVLVLWFILPAVLRDVRIPESPDTFPALRPHFVRLFDDGSLTQLPGRTRPVLGDRLFPSGQRPLLRLWWTGPGDLYVRPRRTHIEVSFTGSGDPVQTVPAPIEATTAHEYGLRLTRTVLAPDSSTGLLMTGVVYPRDAAIEVVLPPGATFADHGDKENGAAAHDEKAETWRKLGTTDDDGAYRLFHAPKAAQALRFGPAGPAPFDPRELEPVAGAGRVTGSTALRVTGEGTHFRSFFAPGDVIRVGGVTRDVRQVVSDTALDTVTAFSPALISASGYERIASSREATDGFTYVSDPTHGLVGGEALMDLAADLGAILCMGATTRLLPDAALRVGTLAGHRPSGDSRTDDEFAATSPVERVFRNWSLDRRRVNEWRMLVSGGALREKDAAADYTAPFLPDGPVRVGDEVSRAHGWVPVLRRWLEVSARTDESGVSPAVGTGPRVASSNRELSQAIAFLFNMPDPVEVA